MLLLYMVDSMFATRSPDVVGERQFLMPAVNSSPPRQSLNKPALVSMGSFATCLSARCLTSTTPATSASLRFGTQSLPALWSAASGRRRGPL